MGEEIKCLCKTFFFVILLSAKESKEFGDDFTNLNTAYFEYLNDVLIITQKFNQAHLLVWLIDKRLTRPPFVYYFEKVENEH